MLATDSSRAQDVKFPPRRLVPPDHPDYPTAHSPLSPLTPSSPLYPDGLIAPIWIRKHTRLVPSVFVVFTRLFEHAPTSRAPLETTEVDREREAEERRKDTELCAEIAARKKTVSERGVKLTVVLLASRRLLGTWGYVKRRSCVTDTLQTTQLSIVASHSYAARAGSTPELHYLFCHPCRSRKSEILHTGMSMRSLL